MQIKTSTELHNMLRIYSSRTGTRLKGKYFLVVIKESNIYELISLASTFNFALEILQCHVGHNL